jgi:hypothetical protein
MILDFGKEVSAIIDALGLDPSEVSPEQGMRVAMVLVAVLDRGLSRERERCIGIVQRSRNVIRPSEVVAEIRKPLR